MVEEARRCGRGDASSRLGEAEVVEELARMLGGDPDDEAALKHAEALRS